MNNMLFLLIAFLGLRCGIEVGNPKPDTASGNGSTLKVRLESGEFEGQSLMMNIASLSLVSDGSDAATYQQESLRSEVDLLSGEFVTDGGALIAEFSNIASGLYSRVNFNLADGESLSFVDTSGTARSLALDEENNRSISFQANIEIEDGTEEELVAIFDTRRSVVLPQESDPQYRFRPSGEAHHKRPGLQFVGYTDLTNATFACAYLVRNLPPPHEHRGRRHRGLENDDFVGGMFMHGEQSKRTDVKPRPSFFDEGVSRAKDETSACDNAFDRVRVDSGEFEFLRLRPGIYDFRVFQLQNGTESYLDQATGVNIEPHRLDP
jgi:hypothetical protein